MKTNLTLFDKLMIAITFAEANEAPPALETATAGNTNRSSKTLLGKGNNNTTLLNGTIGTKAHA